MNLDALDVFRLDDAVWVAHAPIGQPGYDFAFDRYFPCRRPWERPDVITAIGRFGAVVDYAQTYDALLARGVRLIHSPEEHALASELPRWYPSLEGVTPTSACFDAPPPRDVVERRFGWPVFVKGSRQTSRHAAALSVARDGDAYDALVDGYARDPILRWQPCVVREFVPLRPVEGAAGDGVPPSFEFRTFWYFGELVGAGPYWNAASSYDWSPSERADALALARRAVEAVRVPFLVVDLAQAATGAWTIIECNDAQESGYSGVSPFALWAEVARVERAR